MQIEFAPMEGITGYVFRRAHSALFSGVSEYYLPFIATHATRTLKKKELDDAAPANNEGLTVVPQLLSKNAGETLWYAAELRSMGYRRVNLNLGCPSPTVTAKGRGAAMLGDPEGLRRYLEGIFAGKPGLSISVKTRLGIADPEEFEELLPIYNSFPLEELILHVRTLSEGYRGSGHPELLPEILAKSKCPVSYNGNIFRREDAKGLSELCPKLSRVMIGRGLLRNPALAREIAGGEPLRDEELSHFLDVLLEGLRETLPGPVPVLGRMKELWSYEEDLFEAPEPGTEAFRSLRSMKKARSFSEWQMAKAAFFAAPPQRKTGKARWQTS